MEVSWNVFGTFPFGKISSCIFLLQGSRFCPCCNNGSTTIQQGNVRFRGWVDAFPLLWICPCKFRSVWYWRKSVLTLWGDLMQFGWNGSSWPVLGSEWNNIEICTLNSHTRACWMIILSWILGCSVLAPWILMHVLVRCVLSWILGWCTLSSLPYTCLDVYFDLLSDASQTDENNNVGACARLISGKECWICWNFIL